MEYDLSHLSSITSASPYCYVPTGHFVGVILFGDSSSISEQVEVTLQDGHIFATSTLQNYTNTVPPDSCILINNLKHSEWTSVVFPLVALSIILFSLSMIYHIIFKRLMP